MRNNVTNVLEDLSGVEGLEKAEKGSTKGVIKLHLNCGDRDSTLSSEVLTVLGRWDGNLYHTPDNISKDVGYHFVLG